jgi:hypothetical protein
MPIDIPSIISAMRPGGHERLIRYAGASHRDPVAHALCAACLQDPASSESVLKSRAIKTAWGDDVGPEQFSR